MVEEAITGSSLHPQTVLSARSRLLVTRVERITQRLQQYKMFIDKLENEGIFDRRLFRAFRVSTMSQADWGGLVDVSQGTIGNWERGDTYPNTAYRKRLLVAAKDVYDNQRELIESYASSIGIKVRVDPIETQGKLQNSILNAAITDFNYDKERGRIVPVPFSTDDRFSSIDDLKEDKNNLLDSLAEQAEMIISGLSKGANLESDRFIEYFEKYSAAARKDDANPRLLHRLGNTISRRTAEEDVRAAVSGWDEEAIDGFNADHLELMRLYFREALAKAQEVESVPIEDHPDANSYENFFEAADLLSSVVSEHGEPVFDPDIPTLLRDIGREIRDLGEAEAFTVDDRRKAVLKRRRLEAVKNGSIYIGRVLFFTSLFVVMSPGALGAVGSVASILGLMDLVAPGSIKAIYEKLRSTFPILPKLSGK